MNTNILFRSSGWAGVMLMALAILAPKPQETAELITANAECRVPAPDAAAPPPGALDFAVSLVTKTAAHPYFGQGFSVGYALNGVQGMELFLVRGTTYTFGVNTAGHPFIFTSSPSGGFANSASVITDGVANSGATSGTISFTPNAGHPDLMYYNCNVHEFMGYVINISDPADFDVVVVAKTVAHPYFGQGFGAGFSVNNVEGMELNLVRGTTYSFSVNTPGHPFIFTTNSAGGGGNSGDVITDGVTNSGETNGIMTFTPDNTHPSLIYYNCDVHEFMGYIINISDPVVRVDVRMLPEGPYVQATQLMNDALRTGSLIPAQEPFTALGYTHAGGGGGETIAPGVLTVAGNNAAVDWVLVELRDAGTNSVVASKSCIVQRDGDVMNVSGNTTLTFAGEPGNFKVAVRHRNHLGCMTLLAVPLSDVTTLVDLSVPSTTTFGTAATKAIGGRNVLWAGNANFNSQISYTGSNNDRDPILQQIGGTIPTNTTTGYQGTDVNMDGTVKYTGGTNDRDIILQNIGGVIPTNTRAQQLP